MIQPKVFARAVAQTGCLSTLFHLVARFEQHLATEVQLIQAFRRLRSEGFCIRFSNEGGVSLKMKRVGMRALFAPAGRRAVRQMAKMSRRPQCEPLLRQIVHSLYRSEILSTRRSVVDIGAWIGDNALVWAMHLTAPGCVIAIDPSSENLRFIETVAANNSIDNLRIVEAVCSGSPGQALTYKGDLSHAEFRVDDDTSRGIASTTIDQVVESCGSPVIGLLHVDVEGLEAEVLRGASAVIASSRPIIVFEHHLQDRTGLVDLVLWMKTVNCDVRMINEVMPGCRADCRNFIAIPKERSALVLSFIAERSPDFSGYFPAISGPALVDPFPDATSSLRHEGKSTD